MTRQEPAERFGVAGLSVPKRIDLHSGFTMLGGGLACGGLSLLPKRDGA